MRTAVAAITLAATATQAHATSEPAPVWAQLAECSAVFGAVARIKDDSTEKGDLARADEVAARFHAASVASARNAGQADAEAAVASIMGYLGERWDNRMSDILSVRSNLDRVEFCGQLGRAQGVLPLPDQ